MWLGLWSVSTSMSMSMSAQRAEWPRARRWTWRTSAIGATCTDALQNNGMLLPALPCPALRPPGAARARETLRGKGPFQMTSQASPSWPLARVLSVLLPHSRRRVQPAPRLGHDWGTPARFRLLPTDIQMPACQLNLTGRSMQHCTFIFQSSNPRKDDSPTQAPVLKGEPCGW